MYAAVKDGKAGIRGRLVSKTGAILAEILMTDFTLGVAQAFDVNMIPTINISSDGIVSYELVYAPEAFQGATISRSSISNALLITICLWLKKCFLLLKLIVTMKLQS